MSYSNGAADNTSSSPSSNSSHPDNLVTQLAEWKRLLVLCTVPSVKSEIQKSIRHLEEAIAKTKAEGSPTLLIKGVASTGDVRSHISITDFAWDQTNRQVKIYVNVPKAESLPSEKIAVTFSPESVELQVEHLNGRLHRLWIKRLSHPIKPAECSWKVKKDSITVVLAKQGSPHWSELAYKASQSKISSKPADPVTDTGDPGASIMNLMKELYNEGDSEMKRTIAKAWTEANDKKRAGNDWMHHGGGSDLADDFS